MSEKRQLEPQKQVGKQYVVMLALTGFLAVVFLVWYQPCIFWFHANISAISGYVSGKVYKSSNGVFFVRLDSGSQLTVKQSPLKVFLSPSTKKKGFCISHFLVLPASAVGGIDLSQSESFSRQVPIIDNGTMKLKDPMQQNGLFSFPLAKGGNQ